MKIKKWKHNQEYLLVAEPNISYCRHLIKKCAGDQPVAAFLDECGKSARASLYHPSRITDDLIGEILDRASSSEISREMFHTALGLLPEKEVVDVFETLKPTKKEVRDLRRKEFWDAFEKMEQIDLFTDTFVSVLETLELDVQTKILLVQHIEQIFADTFAVKIVNQYAELRSLPVQDNEELESCKMLLMDILSDQEWIRNLASF